MDNYPSFNTKMHNYHVYFDGELIDIVEAANEKEAINLIKEQEKWTARKIN